MFGFFDLPSSICPNFMHCLSEKLGYLLTSPLCADVICLICGSPFKKPTVFSLQELFVMYLTKLAQRHGDDDHRVDYADLAAVVQRKDSMEFLHDIVPKKITFAKYLEMIKNDKENSNDNTDEIM